MKKVDMSEKAVLRRLNQTEQLRELSLALMKAKKESDQSNKKTKVPKTDSDTYKSSNF